MKPKILSLFDKITSIFNLEARRLDFELIQVERKKNDMREEATFMVQRISSFLTLGELECEVYNSFIIINISPSTRLYQSLLEEVEDWINDFDDEVELVGGNYKIYRKHADSLDCLYYLFMGWLQAIVNSQLEVSPTHTIYNQGGIESYAAIALKNGFEGLTGEEFQLHPLAYVDKRWWYRQNLQQEEYLVTKPHIESLFKWIGSDRVIVREIDNSDNFYDVKALGE